MYVCELTLTETPDAAVQANVVDARVSSIHIARILLVPVTQIKYILLPILGIVVKVDLGIHAQYWKGGGGGGEEGGRGREVWMEGRGIIIIKIYNAESTLASVC